METRFLKTEKTPTFTDGYIHNMQEYFENRGFKYDSFRSTALVVEQNVPQLVSLDDHATLIRLDIKTIRALYLNFKKESSELQIIANVMEAPIHIHNGFRYELFEQQPDTKQISLDELIKTLHNQDTNYLN